MTASAILRPHVRTIDLSRERVLRATIASDNGGTVTERVVVLTDDEREFFDSRHNRDIRALMGSNRAPFLS